MQSISDMGNQIRANVSNSSDGSQESQSGSDDAGKSADDPAAPEHEDGPNQDSGRLEDSDLYTIPDNIDSPEVKENLA